MRDALPQASFIGFTGTPIDSADKDTRAVFGDYVSIYDIQDAVDDGATVPIYYESRLAKLVGSEPRMEQVGKDLVNHFESRIETMPGKGMIVCMSREICVGMYDAIVAIKPEWHEDNPAKGVIKIVMAGSAFDKEKLQSHIHN